MVYSINKSTKPAPPPTVLMAIKPRKYPHKLNTTWSKAARINAVAQYLVLGNMSLVSATTGIGHQLLRSWKQQPWWKEVEGQIRSTENLQMDTKLSKIVDKSLDGVLDRIEHGEFFYDQKSGQVKRKPASLRDVARVSVDILTKRELLRGNATERKETTQVSIAEQLKELALEFAKWQKPQKEAETLEMVERVDASQDDIEDVLDILGEESDALLMESTDLQEVSDEGDYLSESLEQTEPEGIPPDHLQEL